MKLFQLFQTYPVTPGAHECKESRKFSPVFRTEIRILAKKVFSNKIIPMEFVGLDHIHNFPFYENQRDVQTDSIA